MKMVIHNGKRYRPEDAERLGLATTEPKKPAKKTAKNKARQAEPEATGADDS